MDGLTPDESRQLYDLLFWAMNPASAGYKILQGWNVIADKLEKHMNTTEPYNAFGNPEPSNDEPAHPCTVPPKRLSFEPEFMNTSIRASFNPDETPWIAQPMKKIASEAESNFTKDSMTNLGWNPNPSFRPTFSVEFPLRSLTPDQSLMMSALESLARAFGWAVVKSPSVERDTVTVSFVPPEERK